MTKLEFPKNFGWGSAVWATGVEGASDKGGKAPTVWDEYSRVTNNERFYDYVGPEETLNWYEDYEKFAGLAQDLHHNTFRTAVLWARLLPDGEHVNEEAIRFYRSYFKAFKDRGMALSVVLYWYDMPKQYEDIGGFTNREVIPLFVRFCREAFRTLGDLVDTWYIYNEPIVDVFEKYLNDVVWPNKLDFDLACRAVYNMLVAHAEVVRVFKAEGYTGNISTVLNHSQIYPRSDHPADLKAAHAMDLLHNNPYEEALLGGRMPEEWLAFVRKYGAEPEVREGDEELIRENTIHYLGLNIYAPARVKAKMYMVDPEAPVTFETFYDPYEMHGRKMNFDRGWEIYPKCLYDALMFFKEKYGNPTMFITENGMGVHDEGRFRNADGMIEDDYRIDFVKKHLVWAHRAIEDGANLVGYNMWSFVDLWSPSNQFRNCYGFYEFDLKTKEVRKKKSADWFKEVTDRNGFDL